MSNQAKTVNRVTLLESIEAASSTVGIAVDFHSLFDDPYSVARVEICNRLMSAYGSLKDAAIVAAQLEAWGDGP